MEVNVLNNYEKIYNDFWKEIVETTKGRLKRDQVKRELSDYAELIQRVCIIYDSITGGTLSKPSYDTSVVLAYANDYMNKVFASLILEDLLPQMQDPTDYQTLLDYCREDLSSEEVEKWEQQREVPQD